MENPGDTDKKTIEKRYTYKIAHTTDMPEMLAASDACIATLMDIAMFKTTYPNKVFDYMAAARPTILAIDGVIRDVIESSHGGIFVQPGNAGALAAAVMELEQDRTKGLTMGKSAREYVMAHFNRANHAEDFMALLERIGQ